MEDMNIAASSYDFQPARAAMQRYVDGNVLAGVSSAVLVGRDLVDVQCIGWADKEAQIPLRRKPGSDWDCIERENQPSRPRVGEQRSCANSKDASADGPKHE